jgi:predicted sulfurtransferase
MVCHHKNGAIISMNSKSGVSVISQREIAASMFILDRRNALPKNEEQITETRCEGLRSRLCSLDRINEPQFSDESGSYPDKNHHGAQKAHQLPLQLTHKLTDNS